MKKQILERDQSLPFNLEGRRQYLLFHQEGSVLAVSLETVREVLHLKDQPISPVPNTLPFLLGLTNLRGEILAVVDFGRFIGGEGLDRTHPDRRILIVESPNPQDVKLPPIAMGLAVGKVEGVSPLVPDQIVSAVEASEDIAPFLKGLYDLNGRLVMILDIEAIVHSDRW